MKALSVKKGNIAYIGNKKYEVINPINLKQVLLRDIESGETRISPIMHLRTAPENKMDKDKNNRPVEQIDDTHWEIAKWRHDVIKPLLGSNRTKKDVVKRANKFGISYGPIYSWIKRFEATGQISSLVPLYENKGGKGVVRIDEPVNKIIVETINELYKTPQRLKVKDVHREIAVRCKNAKLPVPHENTVRNRISEMSKREITAKREGASKSDSVYEAAAGSFEVKYPLEVIQVDETPLDIILVDEVYRKPIGRPYITVAEDVCTRMVFGFCLSLEHPSFYTAGQCLYMGIMPKQEYLKRVGVKGDWDIWGLPKSVIIHTDNADWYRGKDLRRFCEEYGVSLHFRPVKTPKFGGHIERFIGIVNSEIHTFPGTTFSNTKERGEYDSEAKAVATIKELESWITNLIVNVYHNRPHSGLGKMIPKKRYEIGIFGDETTAGVGIPEIIQGEDAIKVRLTLLPSVERSIQRDGVTIDHITYYSDVLRKYVEYERAGKKSIFIFKRDPRDISIIYFYAQDLKEYFPIPYRNVAYPPISVWELRKIQKYLKDKNMKDFNEDDIFRGYAEMNRIKNESIKKSKSVRREQEAKQRYREKTGGGTGKGENKPLYESAKGGHEDIKKAIDSRMDDIFSTPSPFEDIEIIGGKKMDDEIV